jgi:hypothetical protein
VGPRVYDRNAHPARYRYVRIPDDLTAEAIEATFQAALKVAKARVRDEHIPSPQCALSGLTGMGDL